MRDAEYFRKQARRCRALVKTAIQPEEIELFRMWAVDLAAEADEAERRAAKREENHRFRAAEGPSPRSNRLLRRPRDNGGRLRKRPEPINLRS